MVWGTSEAEALADVEYLSRSDHRVEVLLLLADGGRTRAELRETTGASRSTISRILRAFDERHWIARDGSHYETTQLGSFVAEGMADVIERFELEGSLRESWHWLPLESSGLKLEDLTEPVVTRATVDDPYRPITRVESLLADADTFRFVGVELAFFEPCKALLGKRLSEGMSVTVIDPPHVARYIRESYPEFTRRAFESGNLEVLVHDGLPSYGLLLFDGRVGLCAYVPDTGTIRALIDTDARSARAWAEWTFERHRQTARPFTLEVDA